MQVQMTLADESEDYRAFVDKFKPKKTTDDCYTPENIYGAIADWVAASYGIERSSFVRPFYPGGDFERYDYPDGCTVVDNPPFSILSMIVEFYQVNDIPFFLFAPALTTLTRRDDVTAVCASVPITYENGAEVRTSFLTNLEPGIRARSAPDLYQVVKPLDDANKKAKTKELPKYTFPDHVITAAKLGWMSNHGTHYAVERAQCTHISQLDAMRAAGKSGIFGGGLLLSERAAAERAAAERAAAERAAAERAAAERAAAERAAAQKWQLSPRELAMVAMLSRND